MGGAVKGQCKISVLDDKEKKDNTSDRNKDPQGSSWCAWGEYEFGSFIQKNVPRACSVGAVAAVIRGSDSQ